MERKFDPKKLERLNNPERLTELPPEFIISKLNIPKPKLIVDIGAGTGFYSIQLAKHFENAEILACDISDIMLDWMNKNVTPIYKNITTHKMEESYTGLESGIADIALMINLHHELENREKMMKECYRILKNGGKLLISDWKKEEMLSGPPFQIRVDNQDVMSDFSNANFKNIKIFDNFKNNFVIIGQKTF